MTKVYETGHIINVTNFKKLIFACEEMGDNYNPDDARLSIAALYVLHQNSEAALQAVTEKVSHYNIQVNHRYNLFLGLKPLSTRLINRLQATKATDQTIADAKGINRKIQGTRAKKIDSELVNTQNQTTTETKHISVSQQSYVQKTAHFNQLITLLKNEPYYNPNETDLQTTTLTTQLEQMTLHNSKVAQLYIQLTNTRIARNQLLYTNDDSLYNIAQEVKKYIKAIFGASNPQYQQISDIKFTNKI